MDPDFFLTWQTCNMGRPGQRVFLDGDFPVRVCEKCGHEGKDVVDTPSQTRYLWDSTMENPNRDLVLCLECAEEYTRNMDAQWAEYYSSIL